MTYAALLMQPYSAAVWVLGQSHLISSRTVYLKFHHTLLFPGQLVNGEKDLYKGRLVQLMLRFSNLHFLNRMPLHNFEAHASSLKALIFFIF